jgi:hypothetical protein
MVSMSGIYDIVEPYDNRRTLRSLRRDHIFNMNMNTSGI